MSTPTAAPAHFPYNHHTVEQVWTTTHRNDAARLALLDAWSRERALTDGESRLLEQLVRRIGAQL